jgi:8-oxo-dGTP pyrophosphatase MutT (NUDIX family)
MIVLDRASAPRHSSPMHVVPVDHLAFAMAPYRWRFAEERRAEIAAHFSACRRAVPQLWNGRVLMMHDYALAERTLSGALFETGYADFLAWRDWGFPGKGVFNSFSMGALRAADGAFLLGVMGEQTANAGRIYFPAGMLDPADVVDGAPDLAASLLRETEEETGLTRDAFTLAPGWHVVPAGARLAVMKILQAHEPADILREKIRDHIARDAESELCDMRIARGETDLDAMMPDFVVAFLRHMWGESSAPCHRRPGTRGSRTRL